MDARVVANGEGRDVTRVTSQGKVSVQVTDVKLDLSELFWANQGLDQIKCHLKEFVQFSDFPLSG